MYTVYLELACLCYAIAIENLSLALYLMYMSKYTLYTVYLELACLRYAIGLDNPSNDVHIYGNICHIYSNIKHFYCINKHIYHLG